MYHSYLQLRDPDGCEKCDQLVWPRADNTLPAETLA